MISPEDAIDPAEYGDRIADVYDEWHRVLGAEERVTPVVDRLESLAGTGPALELGIGTGRIALPLAARGISVAGIDASERMVARLRAKPGGRDIPVAIGDFADLRVSGGPFSLVYVVFNTFFVLFTQEDQVRCFSAIAENLRPGGAFVMEAFVPDLTRYDHGQRLDTTDITDTETRLSAAVHDRSTQQIRGRNIAISAEGIRVYPVELRYAFPSELDLMARLAGLTLAHRHGGWSGEPFTATSDKHVSVWAKPSA